MPSRRTGQRLTLPLLFALLATLLLPLVTVADGVIVAPPPGCDPACPSPAPVGAQLDVTSHHVGVTVVDQIATTKVDQVFHNPNTWTAEGTYIFPIPNGATISNFTMTVDGRPVEAKMLNAEQARRIYDDTVRQMRDPALLAYSGQGAIQVSVFPIPPGADRHVHIQYEEVLTAENGLVRYRYPLDTERFSAKPLHDVSVRVSVRSRTPIRAIYSSSHQIAVDRPNDTSFTAGWEATEFAPATDFDLYYSLADQQIGANLISTYDPATKQGHFLFLAAPGIDTGDAQTVAKDVIVVLDTSGSMEGEKLAQAKAALTYVLGHLNAGDRFNIVEFSTGARTYDRALLPATRASDAIPWVDGLNARGSTDINLALLDAMAMADPARPTYVLFLTDGLPTEGETEPAKILANVAQAAPANVRLFTFGVGDDVDTFLLDSLVEAHHGRATYVRPGQSVEEIVSAFYAGITTPVLANVNLEISGTTTSDIYPQPLPDLFAGGQMVVAGRYPVGGPVTVTLSGDVNGTRQTFTYQNLSLATAPQGDAAGFVPRLWATRRVGYLLTQIRLHGENKEWIEEIVDLSVRYGIVTPYTSYLVTDEDILTKEGRSDVAQTTYDQMRAAPTQPASGAKAVDAAEASGNMAGASAPQAPAADYADQVRIVGSRAFVLRDGVWTETTYDPSTMTTTKVRFGSDEYFALAASHPDLADAFALSPRVIAISDGQAYEAVE